MALHRYSWSIFELAKHWLKLKGVSNPESHIRYTPPFSGEKTSECIWSTLETPLKSSFEELSFICDRPNSDSNPKVKEETAINKAIFSLKQIVANTESNAVGQGISEKTQKQSLEWIKDNVFDPRQCKSINSQHKPLIVHIINLHFWIVLKIFAQV